MAASTGLTYEQALAAARKVGNANADDAGAMALYCADILQFMVGAASPKLVWEGGAEGRDDPPAARPAGAEGPGRGA